MKNTNELKEATQLYRNVPKDAQMYFATLMNLAAILFKTTREEQPPNQKRA